MVITYRNDELLLNKSCFLPNSFNGNQEARFHFHTTPSTTPKPQFQNEIPYSDTMKAKFQVEISFSHRKKVISQKNIVFSHWTKV